MKEKIILAYSGGLDTSVILKWLVNKGYEVIAYVADIGQKEDFEGVKKKALATGASKVYIEDLKKEFIEEYIFQWLKTGALYEGKYLLGTSIARPLIAKKQVEIARKENAKTLAHGCTGKGNDQVRFELTWMKFMPDVKILSPWKNPEFLDAFKGRSDLIYYAKKHHIPISATLEKPYSIDENIMHKSYESGILEDASKQPKLESLGITSPQKAIDKEIIITIEFEKGVPVKVIDKTHSLEISGCFNIIEHLNKIGERTGIGIIDMVENRFVGIKNRGIYVTPGATILFKAHEDIESITLDKEVAHIKETFKPIISKLIYNGFWHSPEMEFLMPSIEKSQEKATGKVHVTLYKGNIFVTGRESSFSLYNQELSSMDKEGGFNQQDSQGFINVLGLRIKSSAKNETLAEELQLK